MFALVHAAVASPLAPAWEVPGRVAAVRGGVLVLVDPARRKARALDLSTGAEWWAVDLPRSAAPEVAVVGDHVYLPGAEDAVRWLGDGRRTAGSVAPRGALVSLDGVCVWSGEGESRLVDCATGIVRDRPSLPGPVSPSGGCGTTCYTGTDPVVRVGDLTVVSSIDCDRHQLIGLDDRGEAWSRRVDDGFGRAVAVGDVCVVPTRTRARRGDVEEVVGGLVGVGCRDGVPRWSATTEVSPQVIAAEGRVVTLEPAVVTGREPADGRVVWTRALPPGAAVWFTGPVRDRPDGPLWADVPAERVARVDPVTGEGPDLSFPPGTALHHARGVWLLTRPVPDGVETRLGPTAPPVTLALPAGWRDVHPPTGKPDAPIVSWDGDLVWVSVPEVGVLGVLDPETGWQGTFAPGWFFPVARLPFLPEAPTPFATADHVVLVHLPVPGSPGVARRRATLGVFARG